MIRKFSNEKMNLLYYPMSNTHSVTVGLYLKAGIAYESEENQGITRLMDQLHFRRCGNMEQKELYYKMECAGSSLRVTAYGEFVKFSMKVIPERIKDCLEIFANLIGDTEWTESEFLQEREFLLSEAKIREERIFIKDEVKNLIFKDSPLAYKTAGTSQSLKNIGLSEIKAYKRARFLSENMLLCVTGNIDVTTTMAVLESAGLGKFEEVKNFIAGDENSTIKIPKSFHHREPEIYGIITEDELVDVNLSFDFSEEFVKGAELEILNCILGEGAGSRLQQQIREDLGYTFEISSYVERYKDFGVLHIRFTVEKSLLEECIKEVVKEVQKTKFAITKKDLEVSLPFYTTNRLFWEDDTEEMNFRLGYHHFILEDELNECDFECDEKTIVKLQEMARRVFVPGNVCLVMVGDIEAADERKLRTFIEMLG